MLCAVAGAGAVVCGVCSSASARVLLLLLFLFLLSVKDTQFKLWALGIANCELRIGIANSNQIVNCNLLLIGTWNLGLGTWGWYFEVEL